jgi:hypothetical protein
MAAIMSHWFKQYSGIFPFPDNYTTIDLETSGLNAAKRQMCTYGYTRVRDRKPVETVEVVLNWPDYPGVDQFQLRMDLQQVEQAMIKKGSSFFHTFDYLQEHGTDPIEAIKQLLALIEGCEESQEVIVAQNGWAFDTEFMRAAFHFYLEIGFDFDPNLIYDCGIMEKASQLDPNPSNPNHNPLPFDHETIQQWAYRIGAIRARGVKWALDGHCNDKYDIFRKAGLTVADAHRAGSDSLAIHYLFEEQRKLAESV